VAGGLILPGLRVAGGRRELDAGDGINRQLLAFYPMDEAGGDRLEDISAFRRAGIIQGAKTRVVSHAGRATQFDGTQGNHGLLRSGRIISGRPSWSIVAWVRTTHSNAGGGRAVYAERAASGNDIVKLNTLPVDFPNKGYSVIRDTAGTLLNQTPRTTSNVNDGNWHLLVLTKSNSVISIYFDRNLEGTDTWVGSDVFTNSGVESRVGSDVADLNSGFLGGIFGLRLLARALTAREVWRLGSDPWAGTIDTAERLFHAVRLAGASGATYNDTITDAATGADTSASALTTAGSTTDATTAADASASAHVAAASVTDLATVGEAVASALVAPAALSDTATAADVLATTLATSPAISDAATAADSTIGTVAAVTYDEAISDEAAAAEIVAAALAMPASVADAATGADALAALLATSAILVDAATLAEALATTLATSPILTDSVAAGDSAFTSGQAVAVPASRTYRLPTAPRRHALAAESRTYRLRAAPRRYTVPPEA
jgi:hypothetical protein